jgi:hypothetical protein
MSKTDSKKSKIEARVTAVMPVTTKTYRVYTWGDVPERQLLPSRSKGYPSPDAARKACVRHDRALSRLGLSSNSWGGSVFILEDKEAEDWGYR